MDTQNPNPTDNSTQTTPINNNMIPRDKHHDKLVMVVFVLVAIIVAVLLMFLAGWLEVNIPADQSFRPETSFQKEIENLDVGDLDEEFMEIDASISDL